MLKIAESLVWNWGDNKPLETVFLLSQFAEHLRSLNGYGNAIRWLGEFG